MPDNGFLHNHSEFSDLIRIVSEQMGIDPALVEKDYWIMHCLYGLQTVSYTHLDVYKRQPLCRRVVLD